MMKNFKHTSTKQASKTSDWKNDPELEAPIVDSNWDRQLSFTSPDILESLGSHVACGDTPGDYFPRDGYSHLKKYNVNLGALDLTDRQLMAVSLVFYGGLKKNRAARAMKISSQALTDHLKAGLKKIGRSFE